MEQRPDERPSEAPREVRPDGRYEGRPDVQPSEQADRRRTAAAVAAVVVVLAWAWVLSGVRTFTRPAEVLTFLPGLAVLVLTLRGHGADAGFGDRSPYRAVGVLAWALAFAALVGFELAELFTQPRRAHPTLSSLTDSLLSVHPSRFLGVLVWLLLGWLLVRRRNPVAGRHE